MWARWLVTAISLYSDDIIVITLNLSSASVSCNNNDIILVPNITSTSPWWLILPAHTLGDKHHIAQRFGGGKLWKIIVDLPNFTLQILTMSHAIQIVIWNVDLEVISMYSRMHSKVLQWFVRSNGSLTSKMVSSVRQANNYVVTLTWWFKVNPSSLRAKNLRSPTAMCKSSGYARLVIPMYHWFKKPFTLIRVI